MIEKAAVPPKMVRTQGRTAIAHGLPDTFPKLLERNARTLGGRPAIREKRCGVWRTWSWAQVRDEVRTIAAGLADIGVNRGDKVAIIGDNRPQLYWSICAAQAVGAVPVPTYQDSVADELAFVIDHADVDVAIAEGQEHVDKLLVVRDRHKRPARIVYGDPRGLRHYMQPGVMALAELQQRGAECLTAHRHSVDADISEGKGADVAVVIYTSGTTGPPKGVMLTHDNLIVSAHNAIRFDRLTEDDEVLAYLPMASIGDHVFSYAESYVGGFCVSCPEGGGTLLTDLREIGPTFFFAPPRIFEHFLTVVVVRMQDAGWLKRAMFDYFMGVARRAGIAIMDDEPVSLADRALYRLGVFLVYGPLKNALGLTRTRLSYTAGAAIGRDVFDFYRSLGLNLKQLYGTTETSLIICLQPDGQIKPDTVGVAAPEVEIRIADDGEVLVKGPGVFATYYKNTRATAETKTPDGWVHTGDVGRFDAHGHLEIVDRAADLGRLTDGTIFAPRGIENRLKCFPYIEEAVAFGHDRDYVAAFVAIDLEAVGNWAERRGLAYASYQELAAKTEVYDLIASCIERVNHDLAADAKLATSQIKRFLILHKELDAADGELTRTLTVRRWVIVERYAPLIDALYATADRAHIKTLVTFADGRPGTIEADLSIREAAWHASVTKPPKAR